MNLPSQPARIANIVLNKFTNDSRVLKISRSLANSECEVVVIALHEAGLPEHAKTDGFGVERVRLVTGGWPRTKFFQAFKYLEFTLRVLIRYRNFDYYHCNDLHTLPLGVMLRLFSARKTRIIYDAHEYETEANGVGGLEKIFRRILEGSLIRFTSRIVTVSEGIANEYVRLYGVPKPEVVLNIPPYSVAERHDLFRERLHIPAEKTIYLYQGGLSPGRGIDVLLEAFESLADSDSVIVFMGYGSLEERIVAAASRSKAVYFHEAVPPEDIPRYTGSADVGIATIENICLSYYYCLPNKLFEYAMAEIPVIVSNLPEMKAMVEPNGLGVVAPENTVEGILCAIEAMTDFDRARFAERIEIFKRTYNWETQESRLIALYREGREAAHA